MNILQLEDLVKGLPDERLLQEAQQPSGEIPQFLSLSEVQRRKDMRERYSKEAQKMPEGTVADQILNQGIMGTQPPMPQQMPPRSPQQMPPFPQGQGISPNPQIQMPPMPNPNAEIAPQMAAGGLVSLAPRRMSMGGNTSQYDDLLHTYSQMYGIPIEVLKGQMLTESEGNPTAGSDAGAAGLMQLMPGTAGEVGVTDRFDPAQSLAGGAKYMEGRLNANDGDMVKALQAYHSGQGNVNKHYSGEESLGPDGLAYADKVLNRANMEMGAWGDVAAPESGPVVGPREEVAAPTDYERAMQQQIYASSDPENISIESLDQYPPEADAGNFDLGIQTPYTGEGALAGEQSQNAVEWMAGDSGIASLIPDMVQTIADEEASDIPEMDASEFSQASMQADNSRSGAGGAAVQGQSKIQKQAVNTGEDALPGEQSQNAMDWLMDGSSYPGESLDDSVYGMLPESLQKEVSGIGAFFKGLDPRNPENDTYANNVAGEDAGIIAYDELDPVFAALDPSNKSGIHWADPDKITTGKPAAAPAVAQSYGTPTAPVSPPQGPQAPAPMMGPQPPAAAPEAGGITSLPAVAGQQAGMQGAGGQNDFMAQLLAMKGASKAKMPDIADILKAQQQGAYSNALMQLGAGIAGNDLSGGISKAGVALNRGNEKSRELDTKYRMAKYDSEEKSFDRDIDIIYKAGQLDAQKARDITSMWIQMGRNENELRRNQQFLIQTYAAQLKADPLNFGKSQDMMYEFVKALGLSQKEQEAFKPIKTGSSLTADQKAALLKKHGG